MSKLEHLMRVKLVFAEKNAFEGVPREIVFHMFDLHKGLSIDVFRQGLPYKFEEQWSHVACEDYDLAKIVGRLHDTGICCGGIKNEEFSWSKPVNHCTVEFRKTGFVDKKTGQDIFLLTCMDLIPAKIAPLADVPAGWSPFIKIVPKVHPESVAVAP